MQIYMAFKGFSRGFFYGLGALFLLLFFYEIKNSPYFKIRNQKIESYRPKEITAKYISNEVQQRGLPELEFYVVPNIVHFIWIGQFTLLEFHHYLSIKSVSKFQKPELILFHCDYEPIGTLWKKVKKEIKLDIMQLTPPSDVFGNEIVKVEHKSDILRIQILKEHGGIYIDNDVFVLKSLDPLRRYNFTMGIEYHGNPGRLNNGVIISEKGAKFLDVWFDSYKNFTKREWDEHDSIMPYWLQYHYPKLIHVEEKTLNYPSGKEIDLIYSKVYDWHNNYAMHLWHRLHEFDHGPSDIKTMNTTFGQMARYIYYGSPDLEP